MLVFSVDHRQADAALIASLGRDRDALLDLVLRDESVRGAVVLSTCARIEVYVDASRFHDAQRAVVRAWSVIADRPEGEITSRAVTRRGAPALEHLFRVASGLESTVVGEDQVVGQVRDALKHARRRGATTRGLDMAFENAVRVSREARPLIVSRSATSIAGVALEMAARDLGRRVGLALVIGTGSFGELCTSELRSRGVHTVWVLSPSGRTVPGAECLTWDELPVALSLVDVVIAASGHGKAVLTEELVLEVLPQRALPLYVLDLAPGDVAAGVHDLPDVIVTGLDDIRVSAAATGRADALVRSEAEGLLPRIADSQLDEVITALRAHVEAAAARVADPEVGEAMRRLTNTLLHEPTQRARLAAQHGELERFRSAVEILFGAPAGSVA